MKNNLNCYEIIIRPPGHHGRVAYRNYEASDIAMYSHLNSIEYTLMAVHATADIEIIENGQSRWIEYRAGKRTI